jgi:hypothetical protein
MGNAFVDGAIAYFTLAATGVHVGRLATFTNKLVLGDSTATGREGIDLARFPMPSDRTGGAPNPTITVP